jgi:exodeoxyribonuclease VII small subunit
MSIQAAKANTTEDLTFEEALLELEQIVSQLENDRLSLNESLALFERGQILSNHCITILEDAELKVTHLTPGSVEEEA